MLILSKSFGSILLLGGQHARLSVSPTGPRVTRPHHDAVAAPTAAPGLLAPVPGAGALVLPGPGGGPPAVAGGGGRPPAPLPVPGGPGARPGRPPAPPPPT